MTPGDADRSTLPPAPTPDDPARLIDDRTRLYDDVSQLPERRLSLGWIDALVQHRRAAFALVGLLYLASFNGLWRVGVDSALYRGLAHSLAIGRGYTFAGEPHHHAFVGLPWMLALCERFFGDSPLPGQLLITLMALATVAMTYRLIALHYPIWIATIVALAMGTNFRFLRLSQELMTDVPFALGVVVTLYGLERLRMIPRGDRRAMLIAAATLVGGLLFSAAMRPTVGVLVGAIVLASVVRAIRNDDGRRRLHLWVCAVAAVAVAAMWLIDPRIRGVSMTNLVYEREFIDGVQTLPSAFVGKLEAFLGASLNDSFFSQKLQPLSIPVALVLLAGSVLVIRRNLAWGLMVVGVIAITLPLSTAPRYYLMVMPILWLGWLLLFARLTLAAPPIARGAIMLVAVAVPLAMNLGRDSGFVKEQRIGDVAWLRGTAPDRAAGFYASYRDGEVPRLKGYAAAIAAHAGPDDRVLGPDARVLSYYADRRVSGQRELFDEPGVSRKQYPFKIQQFKPKFAIFPAAKVYGDNDRAIRDLIRRRIVSSTGPQLATIDFAWLAAVEVRPPPPGVDWKDWRAPDRRPASQSTTRRTSSLKGLSATQRAAAIAKRERQNDPAHQRRREAADRRERVAKREQDEKRAAKDRRDAQAKKDRREAQAARERRQRGSATAPATGPTTAPAR